VAATFRAQELRETVTDVRSLVERPEPQSGEGEKSRDPVTDERHETMIAKNYMKHPEALRFQRELFSNGYHNSPRIMRLMECIFDWTPVAPGWWTAAKAKARVLAKAIKKSIADFFKETAPMNTEQQHHKDSNGTPLKEGDSVYVGYGEYEIITRLCDKNRVKLSNGFAPKSEWVTLDQRKR